MTATTARTTQGPLVLQPHQQQIHDFVVDRPFAGAWVNIGGGKTLSTLSVLQTVRPAGHILVIAPIAIARSTWLDEIDQWRFPIRTKSLIVDENDRQLSKDKRLARFQEVFTDPPTMYFVNQELLTQAPQPVRLLTPVPVPPGAAAASAMSSADANDVLRLLRVRGSLTGDELVDDYRDLFSDDPNAAVPSRTRAKALIKELVDAGLVVRGSHPCRSCGGDGCAECQFGLIDQMPVQRVNGHDTVVWPFQTVIIDESQGFKSHSSERFKALARMRPAITRLIQLTGTPSPNGLHDLWSQIYLLDQGEALGRNITEFRKRWFDPKMVFGTTIPSKWVPKPNAEKEIYQAISHLVMSAENTTIKLPPVSVQDVNVTLPPDLLDAYKDFRKSLVLDIVDEAAARQAGAAYDDWLKNSQDADAQGIRAELSRLSGAAHDSAYQRFKADLIDGFVTSPSAQVVSTVVAENQAVLTSKLMQFGSGTLYTADPDVPATKGRYQVIHDKKLEMAEYLVRNNGGGPVLIAYHFRSDREQLLARFRKARIDAQAFDKSRAMVRRWNDRKIPVMLLHPASAGHGLNLQRGGSTMIWYTLTHNLEHYLQTNGRLHRPGQLDPVVIYRLITRGTQDERIPSVLAGKEAVQDDLLEALSGELVLLAALEEEIRDDLGDLWVADRV